MLPVLRVLVIDFLSPLRKKVPRLYFRTQEADGYASWGSKIFSNKDFLVVVVVAFEVERIMHTTFLSDDSVKSSNVVIRGEYTRFLQRYAGE